MINVPRWLANTLMVYYTGDIIPLLNHWGHSVWRCYIATSKWDNSHFGDKLISWPSGPCFNIKTVFPCIGIPILVIRRYISLCWDGPLTSTVGPILLNVNQPHVKIKMLSTADECLPCLYRCNTGTYKTGITFLWSFSYSSAPSYWGLVTHCWWFIKQWFVIYSAPTHYLNRCWLIH